MISEFYCGVVEDSSELYIKLAKYPNASWDKCPYVSWRFSRFWWIKKFPDTPIQRALELDRSCIGTILHHTNSNLWLLSEDQSKLHSDEFTLAL